MPKNAKETIDELVIRVGQETLRVESAALDNAASKLGANFVAAVRLILDRPLGKIICSGLGKSGHVARKTAATMSSTGTAAFFVHPVEALHGDLGVVSKGDVLLAFAQSGQTSEVIEVAKHSRRIEVPIIAITGNERSDLAKLSDVVILSQVDSEACPLNLAPTASSTLALALGDALAMALMTQRGFRAEDFAKLHPSGALGRRLSMVKDHMIPLEQVPQIHRSAGLIEILESIAERNFGITAVTDNRQLIGAITDGDVRRVIRSHKEGAFALCAEQIMSRSPKTIHANRLAIDAIGEMESSRKVTVLFVVSDDDTNKLDGLIRLHDLIDAKII